MHRCTVHYFSNCGFLFLQGGEKKNASSADPGSLVTEMQTTKAHLKKK